MALYHTYRPQTFADVLGQPHVVEVLEAAISQDQAGHAYLLSGPRGVGKTSIARILAKALNCEASQPAKRPCTKCDSCQSITAGSALDVLEIDAASNRGIDEIRELRDQVRFAPTGLRHKVYIIDEVHMLTKEAFNALLKTLEEPPKHAVFILATTELNRVPDTILSRCQHFQFRRAPADALSTHLTKILEAEGRTIEPEALELLVMGAEGSYRDALSALEQLITTSEPQTPLVAQRVRALLGLPDEAQAIAFLAALASGDRAETFAILQRIQADGVNIESFSNELVRLTRLLLLLATLGATRIQGGSERIRVAAPALIDALGTNQLATLLGELAQATYDMRRSVLPSLPVELVVLRHTRIVDQVPTGSAKPAVQISSPTQPPTDVQIKSSKAIDKVPIESTAEPRPTQTRARVSLDPAAWSDIRALVSTSVPTIGMILAQLPTPDRDRDSLILIAPFKFHADRLLESRHRDAITSAATQILGTVISLQVEVATKSAERSSSAIPQHIEAPTSDQLVENPLAAVQEL